MKDEKRPLAQMFDMLSREKEILVAQLSKEGDARKRSELNQELNNVTGILSELSAIQ